MERGTDHSHAGDGGPMASGRFPFVLEADFQSSKVDRAETDSEGSSGIDLSHGGRESNMGSAAHPRGASHVGIRYFRTNYFTLDEKGSEGSRTCKTMARIFAESPGSHRGDGLLHRSNAQVQLALLLLRD